MWQVNTDIDEINQKMQNNISNVQTWCHKKVFKISVSKSVAIKRKLPNIELKIEEANILLKNELIIWEFISRQIADTINIICQSYKLGGQKNQCWPYAEH